MQDETFHLVEKYSTPVPRYTSYPTAPHFHAGIDTKTYARWLAALPERATLSLYLHIPYCDRLCWFCGCHTKHTLRYEPVADYLLALYDEIAWISRQLRGHGIVTAIRESAQTGRIGDGKIFVLDLLAVTRIRTGETGAAAL